MVPHRPDQRVRTVKRLLPGICVLGWLLLPQTAILACELAPTSEPDRHPVYVLDPRETTIRFDADARLHTFTGEARRLSGRVRLPDVSRVNGVAACVEVEAKSITTGIGLRDNIMRKSHLHTDRFPTILFTLSGVDQVESQGDDRYAGTLRGTLTLHGVTVPLQVPAKGTLTEQRLVVEGTFPLLLSTFQIPIPALLFIPMKDEVMVHFKVVATRE